MDRRTFIKCTVSLASLVAVPQFTLPREESVAGFHVEFYRLNMLTGKGPLVVEKVNKETVTIRLNYAHKEKYALSFDQAKMYKDGVLYKNIRERTITLTSGDTITFIIGFA